MIISWLIGMVEWGGYLWSFLLVAAAVAAFFYIPKVGTHIAVICLMVAGGTYLLRDAYSRGETDREALWQAKFKAETERRDAVLEKTQKDAAESVIAYQTERQNNERLQREIALTPASGTGDKCLSPDVLRKLQQFRSR